MGSCGNCCVSPEESREPIKYDPDFKGPTENRSCTDVLWLILFLILLGAWIVVGCYSISKGSVEKLLAPVDSNGKRCGMDLGLEDKKYLVFFDISRCLAPGINVTVCPTPQVCVEKCPDRTIIFSETLTASNFETLRSSLVCSDEVNTRTLTYNAAQSYMKDGKCATFVIQSQPVLGRCFVNVTEALAHFQNINELGLDEQQVAGQISKLISFNQISAQIVQDLVQSRWYLLGALGVVVIICFIYILLLRWVVTPVVWTSIAALLALLGFCIYLCCKNYIYYRNNPVGLYQTTNLKEFTQSIFTKSGTWLALMIAIAVVLVILLIMVVFLRSRIGLAIALIREGSKAVTAIKSTVLFPIFPWLLQCAVIAYGVTVLVSTLSIGEPTYRVVNLDNSTCNCQGIYTQNYVTCDPVEFNTICQDLIEGGCSNATCHYTGINHPYNTIYLHIINVLSFYWSVFFISGVSDMMLASTFSTWYWTFHKRDLPFFTLTSGIVRTLRFHLGTVALGALIITIVRIKRVILQFVDKNLKKYENPLTKLILCCCQCFLWCLENCLAFINKNAYIMCAVHGHNFCTSARQAFSLIMRNIMRVVVLDKVTDFIFFLSKLLISIGVGVSVYYLLQWSFVYEVTQGQPLHYNYVPAIILSIATYLICTIFFNVYSMAVDTLFLCFLEDCERNDGSQERPYYMSKNLMKILGKGNKQS